MRLAIQLPIKLRQKPKSWTAVLIANAESPLRMSAASVTAAVDAGSTFGKFSWRKESTCAEPSCYFQVYGVRQRPRRELMLPLKSLRFHSTQDKRIPSKFICFDCRIRGDLNWDLIWPKLYPSLLSKHRDLALFRSFSFPSRSEFWGSD